MKRIYQEFLIEQHNERGEVINIRYKTPEKFNFGYDIVDRIAAEKPEKLAMLWCNEAGDEKRISFGELKKESDKAAQFFLSLGIRKGDTVVLILKRHYEWWYSMVALHKIGAIAIPATNQLQKKDIVYRFNAADVKAIICTADGAIASIVDESESETPTLKKKIIVRGTRDGWVSYDEGTSAAGAFVKPTGEDLPGGKDILFIYFSSGTTGMPKMVAHNHWYPLAHIPTAVYWHNVDPDGIHLTVSETGWAKSVWGKIYGQWIGEAAVFTFDFDRFNPDALLRNIEKYRITTFCAPPTIYRFLIKEDLTRFDLSSLQHGTTAGEALNAEVYKKFHEVTGLKLMEGFGQTETTLLAATMKWMEPKPGSMGKPSPAYRVDVVDEDGNSLDPGKVGEVVIRTDGEIPVGLFLGYHRDEALTNSSWHDGLYHTGDTAWKDEDGFLWYVGRVDDIIKSSGYRIGPFEVESVIMEHASVLECAVTGIPDDERGQIVKATIVLCKGYEKTDALKKEIQEYVKTHTAPYKYPRMIEFVDELPKTISGKIRRTEIRAKDWEGPKD